MLTRKKLEKKSNKKRKKKEKKKSNFPHWHLIRLTMNVTTSSYNDNKENRVEYGPLKC